MADSESLQCFYGIKTSCKKIELGNNREGTFLLPLFFLEIYSRHVDVTLLDDLYYYRKYMINISLDISLASYNREKLGIIDIR